MTTTIKEVASRMVIIAVVFSTFFYQPKPAQAITGEEFLRLLSIWGRYAEDLHKNFGPGYRPPTPQTLPSNEPINPFNPAPVPTSEPLISN